MIARGEYNIYKYRKIFICTPLFGRRAEAKRSVRRADVRCGPHNRFGGIRIVCVRKPPCGRAAGTPDGLRIEEQQGLFGFLYGPAQRSRADAKGGCMQFSVQYYRSGYREVPEFFALAARKT